MKTTVTRLAMLALACLALMVLDSRADETAKTEPPSLKIAAPTGEEGVITASRLNVRVCPDTKCKAVTVIKKETHIEVISKDQDWLEIAAPKDVPAWISSEDVDKDGVILKDGVRVHCDADSKSQAYNGSLNIRDMVEVLGEEKEGWLKIIPPKNRISAWISRHYVKLLPPMVPIITSVAPDKNTDPKPSETPWSIQASTGRIIVTGYLLPLEAIGASGSTHKMVAVTNGKAELVALVACRQPFINLKEWEQCSVKIYGRDYPAPGEKDKLVMVEGIQLVPKNP